MGRSEELEILLCNLFLAVYVPLAWRFETEPVLFFNVVNGFMTLVFAGPFGEIRGAGDIALQPVLSCVCATSFGGDPRT